jgi:hypothetical protein
MDNRQRSLRPDASVARHYAGLERGPPAHEYKRVLLLVLIMSAVAVSIGSAAILILYETALFEERQRLVDALRSQTRLIAAIVRQEQRLEPHSAQARAASRKFSMPKPLKAG